MLMVAEEAVSLEKNVSDCNGDRIWRVLETRRPMISAAEDGRCWASTASSSISWTITATASVDCCGRIIVS